MTKRRLPLDFVTLKRDNIRFSMLTSYDAPMTTLLEDAGIEMILIGDSLGNVFAGHDSTIPVTLDHMIYHCQAVSRGSKTALLVADMPFMTTQISVKEAKRNAGRLIQEGQVQAVKVEVFSQRDMEAIEAILDCGIPVLPHLGLTPQSVYQLGGYKKQANDEKSEETLRSRAQKLEKMGCFGVLLECIPEGLARDLTQDLTIPVIGIGSGPDCDAQVLVTHDLLGMGNKKPPSFVTPYAAFYQTAKDAVSRFNHDVQNRRFPDT